jgi:hypothetical protein
LELARLKVVRVLQSPDGETLFVSQISGSRLAEARRVEVTSALGEQAAPGENTSAAAADDASAVPAPADGPLAEPEETQGDHEQT